MGHLDVKHPDSCVLGDLVDRWAAETPDATFLVGSGPSRLDYAGLRSRVRRVAGALQTLGVGRGEAVLVWLPNSFDGISIWFGINYIGAVYVPINTAYRGGILEHVLRNSKARFAIVHADLLSRLADIDTSGLRTIVVLSGTAPADPRLTRFDLLGPDALAGDAEPTDPDPPIRPTDTQSIIYTSGTTGPSKGVLSSYAHLAAMGGALVSSRAGVPYLAATDRFMVNLPMFHVGGTAPTYAMLSRGGSIALLEAFDTASFWPRVRETGTTCVILLGVMASFLAKQPPGEGERDHPLRHAIVIPLGEEGVTFGDRFGTTIHTLFNMSEVSCPLIAEENPRVVATCGRPRAGVTVRLVDANDHDVADGAVGELILRTEESHALNHGYNGDPEATALAWRGGWFHTGDAFRVDGEGNYFFVDRFKDVIRRRGENVSSFEVELEVGAHPAVREAAAVAVPSEFGEDEILVAISTVDGMRIDFAELVDFLRPRMAQFMVPRYLRVMEDLPKTPTRKVEKYLIRQAGVTPDTWDRERAGIRIGRDRWSA